MGDGESSASNSLALSSGSSADSSNSLGAHSAGGLAWSLRRTLRRSRSLLLQGRHDLQGQGQGQDPTGQKDQNGRRHFGFPSPNLRRRFRLGGASSSSSTGSLRLPKWSSSSSASSPGLGSLLQQRYGRRQVAKRQEEAAEEGQNMEEEKEEEEGPPLPRDEEKQESPKKEMEATASLKDNAHNGGRKNTGEKRFSKWMMEDASKMLYGSQDIFAPASREYLFKVLLIGDPGVGKTSFVQRYTSNTFRTDYKGTVGVDFALKILRVGRDARVKLQLWDIAGQERFTWMTRVYYRDARGCVVMFDLSDRSSFENAARWKRDLDEKCGRRRGGGKVPCLLLANKCDLSPSERRVTIDEIDAFYRANDFIGWTETSAKDDTMVADSVKFLVDTMIKAEEEEEEAEVEAEEGKTVKLGTEEPAADTRRSGKGCFMC